MGQLIISLGQTSRDADDLQLGWDGDSAEMHADLIGKLLADKAGKAHYEFIGMVKKKGLEIIHSRYKLN